MTYIHTRVKNKTCGQYFYLCVCEEKDSIIIVHSSHGVKLLQIFMEGVIVVPTRQLDLKALVATDMGR